MQPKPKIDEHGIDHEAPFSTCPRISGAPLDLRIGDDRLIRRAHDGGVEVHIGYYSEYQQRSRKLFAKLFYDRMKDSPFFSPPAHPATPSAPT